MALAEAIITVIIEHKPGQIIGLTGQQLRRSFTVNAHRNCAELTRVTSLDGGSSENQGGKKKRKKREGHTAAVAGEKRKAQLISDGPTVV